MHFGLYLLGRCGRRVEIYNRDAPFLLLHFPAKIYGGISAVGGATPLYQTVHPPENRRFFDTPRYIIPAASRDIVTQ